VLGELQALKPSVVKNKAVSVVVVRIEIRG
jgi:hypothetical protein